MHVIQATDAPGAFRRESRSNLFRRFYGHSFTRNFWLYFCAVLFFDAGYGIYFFLFNLYLLDLGYSERPMGWIAGAMTLGSLLTMIPVGTLSRKIGLKPLIVACFIASPLLNGIRLIYMWWPAQIALAACAGMTMSLGTVCYLPAVARLTNDRNRTAAFTLIISASLATSALGGIVCGYLPRWIASAGVFMHPADLKRLILLVSCALVTLGLLPLIKLRIPEPEQDVRPKLPWPVKGTRTLSPFMIRFLPVTALWAAVIASFTPFGSTYLASVLHLPMTRIGIVYSSVQVLQFGMGFATPLFFRFLGLARGIVALQSAAAVTFCALALARDARFAIGAYLIVSALQWMSSPGLYDFVMSGTRDGDRNIAAAATLFSNSAAGSVATICAGILFARFGYPLVLLGVAALAFTAALLVRFLLTPQTQQQPVAAQGLPEPEN